MAEIYFTKWQGTGNDFVILDNRDEKIAAPSSGIIKKICDRHFGVGADGLMILNNHPDYDFGMQYFNADGIEAEMCGNGARCMIGFAYQLGIIAKETRFMAHDGIHIGHVLGKDNYQIQMIDVEEIKKTDDYYFLNTGVPHVVIFTDDIEKINVREQGSHIRYSPDFAPDGCNVNFVHLANDILHMRTYERGVENETLSCGTGAVASAIAAFLKTGRKQTGFTSKVPGGELIVKFEHKGSTIFRNILLEGPAQQVFSGNLL